MRPTINNRTIAKETLSLSLRTLIELIILPFVMIGMKFFVLLAILQQFVGSIFGANILGYLVTPMRSHFIIHDSLLRGLAAKGHNVSLEYMVQYPIMF